MFEKEIPDDVVLVPFTDINLNDTTFQFRIDTSTKGLKESIDQSGQVVPVILRGQKPYQIVCGFRRIKCGQELGHHSVLAVIHEVLGDSRAYVLAFAENEKRNNLTPLDKANAVAKLRAAGNTFNEICYFFTLGERQIRNLDKVRHFPKALKEAIVDDKITLTHAVVLFDKGKGRAKFDYPSWIERIAAEEMSVADLQKALRKDLKREKGRTRLYEKRGDGFHIYSATFDPQKTSPAKKKTLIEALKKALAVLEGEG